MKSDSFDSETTRLEELWSGEFGDNYTERNASAGEKRQTFWDGLLAKINVSSVLEVGCNAGANIGWIARLCPPEQVYGIDVNKSAIEQAERAFPAVNFRLASAKELPFTDGFFDLAFTMGVLIHQPEDGLRQVMSEIVRCSRALLSTVGHL